MQNFSLALIATFLATTSCQASRTFPSLSGVTRADIRTNHDSLGTVTDSAQLASVVAFINSRRRGWIQSAEGVGVGTLGVSLYRGTEFLGTVMAGNGFFETQRDGDFFARPASTQETTAFRRLLNSYQGH